MITFPQKSSKIWLCFHQLLKVMISCIYLSFTFTSFHSQFLSELQRKGATFKYRQDLLCMAQCKLEIKCILILWEVRTQVSCVWVSIIWYLLCKAMVACMSVSLCAVLGFLLMPLTFLILSTRKCAGVWTHPFIPSIDIFLKFIVCQGCVVTTSNLSPWGAHLLVRDWRLLSTYRNPLPIRGPLDPGILGKDGGRKLQNLGPNFTEVCFAPHARPYHYLHRLPAQLSILY